MPPKRKATSAFSGPGRVLGSGEEKAAKRPRKSQREEQEADYVPPKEEGDDANKKAKPMPKARKRPERTTGYLDAVDAQGNTIRVKASDIHIKSVNPDPKRYGGRSALVAIPIDQSQKDKKPTYEYIACKNGTYFRKSDEKLSKATNGQIAKWEADEDDGLPCECRVCAQLAVEEEDLLSDPDSSIPYGTLRSGAGRGFHKYGEGKTL